MTPIKTLEEAIYSILFEKSKVDGVRVLYEDEWPIDKLVELFSSLTEQMIPEEKDANEEALNVKSLSFTAVQAASEALKFHGYNQAISQMNSNRNKILGK